MPENDDPTPTPPEPASDWPDPVVIAKDELKDRILMLGVILRTKQPNECTLAFPYADLVWVAGTNDTIVLSVGGRAEFEVVTKDRHLYAKIIDNLRYGVLEILRDESPRPPKKRRISIVGYLLKGVDDEGNVIREPI